MQKSFNQSGIIHILPLLVIVAAVGIISFLLISSTAPSGGIFGKINPKPASHAATNPVKIMALGDSITYGVGDANFSSYRGSLYTDLQTAGINFDFVGSIQSGNFADPDNEGHSGGSALDIYNLVNEDLLSDYNPDIILLLIGTNNLGDATNISGTVSLYNSLLDKIYAKSPNVTVVVGSVPPKNSSTFDSQVIIPFNTQLLNIVNTRQAQGAKIFFSDIHSSVTLSDLPDGVHPNAAGFNKMATVWNTTLQSVFASGITPAPIPASTTTSIDDSITGSGLNQFNYQGAWTHCSSCGTPLYKLFNGSSSSDNISGDTMTFTFSGQQIALYGARDINGGIGAVSLDNGLETNLDYFFAYTIGNQVMYLSPVLTPGTHTLKLRVTGTKNGSSGGFNVTVDRVKIYPATTVTPTPSPSPATCPKGSIGDIDCDGKVSILDYSTLVGNYGKTVPAGTQGDLNNSGKVDIFDYSTLVSNYGK